MSDDIRRRMIRVQGRGLEVEMMAPRAVEARAGSRPEVNDEPAELSDQELDELQKMMAEGVRQFGAHALTRDTPFYRDGKQIGVVRYRGPHDRPAE